MTARCCIRSSASLPQVVCLARLARLHSGQKRTQWYTLRAFLASFCLGLVQRFACSGVLPSMIAADRPFATIDSHLEATISSDLSRHSSVHARQHRKIENPGVPTRPPKKSALQVNAVAVPLGCGHLAPLERRPVVCSLARPRPYQPSSQRSATQARPFGPLGIDKVASDANSIRPPTSAAAHSRVKAA